MTGAGLAWWSPSSVRCSPSSRRAEEEVSLRSVDATDEGFPLMDEVKE